MFTFSAAKVNKFSSVLSLQMQLLRYLLFPFSLIYIGITQLRHLLFTLGILKQRHFKVPVIVVGNLSTGGTGKSPMIDYLLKLLSVQFKSASLSRGYGRKSGGFAVVKPDSKTQLVGDEPVMLKMLNPAADIFVHENRVEGIEMILANQPATNVILLDDAFQHRYVKPGLAILLTTFDEPFYSDFVLPLGNLRELRNNAKRAQVIVVTKCPVLTNEQMEFIRKKISKYSSGKVFFAGIGYGKPVALFENFPFPDSIEQLLLVTGIAKPYSLSDQCRSIAQKVSHLAFKDHHAYTMADFNRIAENFNSFATQKKVVLTTHKDAVKWLEADDKILELLKKLPVFYQPMQMMIQNNPNEFNELILNYVRSTQPNC